jgi:hypothetical protein
MADPQNLYAELKDALQEFETFLEQTGGTIKPALPPIDAALSGQVTQLLNKLIELMNKLKEEITKINVGNVPGLSDVSKFTKAVEALLKVSKDLFKNDPGTVATVDDVLSVVNIVSGLPTLDNVKQDIIDLLNNIIGQLTNLKPAT